MNMKSSAEMYKQAGLDADAIVETVFKALGQELASRASLA